jgi:hypothetical protein
MTKKQLELAQFLLSTSDDATRLANEFDPEHRRESSIAIRLDNISASARNAFVELTGRHVTKVQLFELSTENPAEWTRSVR